MEVSLTRKTKYDFEKAHSMVEGAFSCFDQDNSGCLKKT